MGMERRYFCEYYDCDGEVISADPPELCPSCGLMGWREFQTPDAFAHLDEIFGHPVHTGEV